MMTTPLVLPGLHDPADVRVRELRHHGARVWIESARRSAVLPILPDLSCDVILTANGPRVMRRTVNAIFVPIARSASFAGVRLPIAAVDVHVDVDWSGWRSACSAEETLAHAVTSGAISWAEDPLVAAFLAAIQSPRRRVADAAGTAFVSERTLRRRVGSVLGVTPADARRILRLHRLSRSIRHHSVSEAAAIAGYADQAHAARDVRSTVGMRLREFARLTVAD